MCLKIINMKQMFYCVMTSWFLFISSCQTTVTVRGIAGTRIPVDSTYNQSTDLTVMSIIQSYKSQLDEQMNVVIGEAAARMWAAIPESPLTNLTADVILAEANKQAQTDFSIMNHQGIRATVNQGAITLGNMYELFPFENQLVMLDLKGQYVEDLFKFYARKGGEGVSSSVQLVIKDKTIHSLLINGKPLDKDKTYRIATIDYLAQGNDGMKALSYAENITTNNKLLRTLLVEYVKEQTAQGKSIHAVNDGRIKIISQ